MERHDYRYDINADGGGHGNSNVLWGAAQYFPRRRINATVTTNDDGGCSGVMVEEFPVGPPGDMRMCAMPLALPETQPENNLLNEYRFRREGSLSDYTIQELTMEILKQNHETLKKAAIAFRRIFGIPLRELESDNGVPEELKKLMEFKFPEGKSGPVSLMGRCYGNLAIVALELAYKDPRVGFEAYKKVFGIQGEVVPVTSEKHPVLHGVLTNGEVMKGESKIGGRSKDPNFDPRVKLSKVYHDGQLSPYAEYLLLNSYLRVISPGSTDTSIGPVIGTKGFAQALEKANRAGGKTVIIPSIMNSEGTEFADAAELIENYLSYLHGNRGLITDVILSATPIPYHGEQRYAEYGQTKIEQNDRNCQILLPKARIHRVDDLIEYDMSTGRVGHKPRVLGEALKNIWLEAA